MDASEAADTGAEQVVPPVVAVLVTCDPGWWMEECLASLADQDYPALSVLVIDADSAEDPTARVASVMPTAFVRRIRRRRGFAGAANEVLSVVEGASHFLFCHDDVSLAPSAVRILVEEAFRNNAGAVTPKLVAWHHPDRLLAVGMGMDAFGVPVPIVERGELDQQQHDGVRDVFLAPAACTLVRADLFASLGGFDAGVGVVGEDIDLGWRVHLAGARVVTAPDAVVRHLEVTIEGRRALDGTLRGGGGPHEALVELPHPVAHLDPEGADDGEIAWGDEPDLTDRRGRRRARRDAEREVPADAWLADDDDWDAGVHRRRRHRLLEIEPPPPPTTATEPRGPDADELDERRQVARLRAVLSNYSAVRLAIRLPVLLAITLAAAAVRLWRDGADSARRPLHPWAVALRDSGAIRKHRRAVRRTRAIGDGEIVQLQVGGANRATAAFQAAASGAEHDRTPSRRPTLLIWLVALVVVGFGSRHLLTGHLPDIREFAPWPSVGTLAAAAGSGWRLTGLGVAGPAPTIFGLLTVAGAVFLGHTTVLQHVLIFGLVPLGALGVYRTARAFDSRRAQVVALIAYLAVPLPYNAIARGEWSGLAAYAAAPWVLQALFRAAGWAPFGAVATRRGRLPLNPVARLVGLAVIAALAGAVQPGILFAVVLSGAGVFLGGLVTGERQRGLQALAAAVLASIGAIILLFPWSLSWLPPAGEWATFTRASAGARPALHLATLLRFQTGPLGAGFLGYALLVAAALPLVIGRAWRSDTAVRVWAVALVAFAGAWAGQHHALGLGWPIADVLLAPAAVAVALAVALGMTAFDTDLTGFTFGWRQVVAGIAAAATALALLPVVAEAVDGRWQQRSAGYDALYSWMATKRADGDFRVLWLGSPDLLPVSGWRIADGLAYATSRDGTPQLTDDWPGTSHGTTRLLAQAVDLVRRGYTTQVGHILAPMGVRYVVVVQSPAPLDTEAADVRAVPPDLTAGLASQVDLEPVDQSFESSVYQNAAWVPIRTTIQPNDVPAAVLNDPRAARTVDLGPASPVLTTRRGPTSASGPLAGGTSVEVAEAPSAHWQLTVDGKSQPRRPAFASANLFTVTAGGHGVLRYRTPIGWRLADLIALALWVGALGFLIRARRSARWSRVPPPTAAAPSTPDPAPLAPVDLFPSAPAASPSPSPSLPSA